MRDFNIEVKKEFNKHHNLALVQEKFPELSPSVIIHYILDTAVSKNRTIYNNADIKKVDITTDIKPITISDIITNIDDKDIKFTSSEGREINITGRKTINY